MSGLIINPGSRIPQNPQGWTNTYEQARRNAEEWLEQMRRDGFGHDVILLSGPEKQADGGGRWIFRFQHQITGVCCLLETHGISDEDLEPYRLQAIFLPRVYWNGSSSANPALDDFAAPGYVQSYRKVHQ